MGCAWSLHDDLVRSSEGSWHEDLTQGLLQFLVRISCRDPGEILQEVLAAHDLVQVLVRSSCGDPSEMVLEAFA